MRCLFILISIVLRISTYCYCQNLIPNSGFEQHGNVYRAVCKPDEFSEFVRGWVGLGMLPPHQIYLTKDYQPSIADVEQVGYDLDRFPPHTGKAMIRLWAHPSTNQSETCREGHGGSIYTTLLRPIQAGKCHKISFWYYIKPSSGSQMMPTFFENFGITLYNSKPSNRVKQCLLSTNSPLLLKEQEPFGEGEWRKQEFYVVTENAFKSLAIGFFNHVSSQFNYNSSGLHYYVHIDDVEATPIDDPADSVKNKIIYYPNPMDHDNQQSSENTWMDYAVYFATNSDTIEQQYLPDLDTLANMLQRYPNRTICITGFTDKVGDTADNQTLSQKRALAVKNYLVNHKKVKDFRVFTSGKGVDTRGDLNNYTQNRRVDIEEGLTTSAEVLFKKAAEYGTKKRADSTFFYLRTWLTVEPEHWMELYINPNFEFLKNHKSWSYLEETIKKKYNKYQKPEDAFLLEKLYYFDQKYRSRGYIYSPNTLYVQDPGKQDTLGVNAYMLQWNLSNLEELKRITSNLDNAPDPTEVSRKAYTAIVYVLQHSHDISLRKKFCKVLEGHCQYFKRWCQEYAMMYDRLLIDETGFQKYGTHFSSDPKLPSPPLENPERLNEYRRNINLGILIIK